MDCTEFSYERYTIFVSRPSSNSLKYSFKMLENLWQTVKMAIYFDWIHYCIKLNSTTEYRNAQNHVPFDLKDGQMSRNISMKSL